MVNKTSFNSFKWHYLYFSYPFKIIKLLNQMLVCLKLEVIERFPRNSKINIFGCSGCVSTWLINAFT